MDSSNFTCNPHSEHVPPPSSAPSALSAMEMAFSPIPDKVTSGWYHHDSPHKSGRSQWDHHKKHHNANIYQLIPHDWIDWAIKKPWLFTFQMDCSARGCRAKWCRVTRFRCVIFSASSVAATPGLVLWENIMSAWMTWMKKSLIIHNK